MASKTLELKPGISYKRLKCLCRSVVIKYTGKNFGKKLNFEKKTTITQAGTCPPFASFSPDATKTSCGLALRRHREELVYSLQLKCRINLTIRDNFKHSSVEWPKSHNDVIYYFRESCFNICLTFSC